MFPRSFLAHGLDHFKEPFRLVVHPAPAGEVAHFREKIKLDRFPPESFRVVARAEIDFGPVPAH